MAVYKVPQDVEADDKLIGPFSFRQFIYLIIAAIAIAIGWGLSRLFIPLAILPLPVIIFFGALALPLRKDQPMEIYLAAIVSYHLKPRRRLWQADGIQSLVEITAPKENEIHRSKDLSQMEAQQRLSYLADIVDTGGWAVRGISMPEANTPMNSDAYFAAQQTEDLLDDSGGVSRQFDSMITQSDARRREELVARIHQPPAPLTPPPSLITPITPDPYANLNPFLSAVPLPNEPPVTFNPYPTSIHQTIINPIGSTTSVPPQAVPPVVQQIETPPSTSEKVVSPDIINLANNSDLSIETIAHEAQRIHEREQLLPENEVVVSLR
jgi:hypothetical protein